MEALLNSLLAQYGLSGVIIGLLVWQFWQNSKDRKTTVSKDDLKSVQSNIQTNVEGQIDNIKSYIQSERDVLKEMIDLSDSRLEMLKEHVDDKFGLIEDRIKKQPKAVVEAVDARNARIQAQHDQQFDRQLELGPKLHEILANYMVSMHADHIFVGSFHNGTSNLSGVPYYKFDVIAERFNPDKVKRDVEFAHMYYNADLMKHDKLPITLMQNNKVHYIIDENGQSELSQIDDIIYRRMIGRDIKQFAVHLLRDSNMKPAGFVGCVRYDYEEIIMDELGKCAAAIEDLYKD